MFAFFFPFFVTCDAYLPVIPAHLQLSRRILGPCKLEKNLSTDKRVVKHRKSLLQADSAVINIFEQTEGGPILFKIFFVAYIGLSTIAGLNELRKRASNRSTM
jgi:hypothetical protein